MKGFASLSQPQTKMSWNKSFLSRTCPATQDSTARDACVTRHPSLFFLYCSFFFIFFHSFVHFFSILFIFFSLFMLCRADLQSLCTTALLGAANGLKNEDLVLKWHMCGYLLGVTGLELAWRGFCEIRSELGNSKSLWVVSKCFRHFGIANRCLD